MSDKFKSLTRQVTNDVLECIKHAKRQKFKRKLPGRKKIYIWSEHHKRDPDQDLEMPGFFVKLSVTQDERVKPAVDAITHEEELEPIISLDVFYNPYDKKQIELLYYELFGTIRHEIEHLTDQGSLALPGPRLTRIVPPGYPASGKILHSLNRRRKLFSSSPNPGYDWDLDEVERYRKSIEEDFYSYITCFEELGPFVVGFYAQAKLTRQPFSKIVNDYMDYFVEQGCITIDKRDLAIDWINRWARDKYPKVIIV